MPNTGSLSIDQTLEENAVFRAAWRLMLETPSGRKTVVVPGTQTGAIAIAFNRFRMGRHRRRRKTERTPAPSRWDC